MRRFIAKVILGSAVFAGGAAAVSPRAFADDLWDKGGRGVADIVTSPYEVVRQGKIDYDEKGGIGIFTGGFRGIGSMVGRLGVGVYELVTFPLPGYDPILDPEFTIPPAPRGHADWGENEISRVY